MNLHQGEFLVLETVNIPMHLPESRWQWFFPQENRWTNLTTCEKGRQSVLRLRHLWRGPLFCVLVYYIVLNRVLCWDDL
jgi:hypothetical protein